MNLYILSEIQAEGDSFGLPELAGFPHLVYRRTIRYYVPYLESSGCIDSCQREYGLRCELGGYSGPCECVLVLGINCVDFVEVVNVS